jgi:predicted metalloprotease
MRVVVSVVIGALAVACSGSAVFDPPVAFDIDVDEVCDQADRRERSLCLIEVYSPLLDAVFASAMESRGIEFRPPRLALEPGETECGYFAELVYCSRDDTVMVPVEVVSDFSDRGSSAALDRVLFHPAVQEYITRELTEDERTTGGAYSAVVGLVHEYGHHVQNMVGTLRTYRAEAGDDRDQRVAATRRLELEADCLAGWFTGYLVRLEVHVPSLLDNWAAITTLTAIGDDFADPSMPAADHGLIEQRVGAWQEGITFGVRVAEPYGACVAVAEAFAGDDPDADFWDRSVVNGCRLEAGARCGGVDLSGENLFAVELEGADLSGADLFYSILTLAQLADADLSDADLRLVDLGFADLRNVDLSGADLSGASLFRADLAGANLSGADLTGAVLDEANLDGVDFSGTIFAGTSMADGAIRSD